MNRIGVLHLTDTLDLGGYERVAVNLVNHLPQERYAAYLCTTRREGPLAAAVEPHVGRLALERRRSMDVTALARLVSFVRRHDVRILHAHGASLFIARVAALVPPFPAVIWHTHFGRMAAEAHAPWPYRAAALRIGGVIAVNQSLLEWSRRSLGVPEQRSWYIPNLVSEPPRGAAANDMPGVPGSRIVCVANLRKEKDHATLLRALMEVTRKAPAAHLILVGAEGYPGNQQRLRELAAELGVERHVSFLGQRADVAAILRACDVGVLSSSFEGLPMALLEYGMSGLPAVATTAGQCAEVLDHGRAGVLVPPGDPARLAEGLLLLLESAERRARYGNRLRAHVAGVFSPQAVIGRISAVYVQVAGAGAAARRTGTAESLTAVTRE